MKKIIFTILVVLCCIPTIVFASNKDTDTYIECWYNYNSLYLSYNATTDTLSISHANVSYLTWDLNSVKKSDFVDQTTNKLKCPQLNIKIGTNTYGNGGLATVSTSSSTGNYSPIKTNEKNNNGTTVPTTCVYNSANGQIEFTLDTVNKKIKSAKVGLIEATLNEFTYDEVYQNSKCVDIKEIYTSCSEGTKEGATWNVCHIVKKMLPTMDNSGAVLNPDDSTSETEKDDDKNNDTNTNTNGNQIGTNATASDFIGNLTCGGTCFEFHKSLPNFTSRLYDLLKIGTPVIVIITGMLDLFKAVSAQKEDEIKKSQQKLLRRLLAGAIVFLVFVIVDAAIHMVAERDDAENAMDCVDCFLGGAENCSTSLPTKCNNS